MGSIDPLEMCFLHRNYPQLYVWCIGQDSAEGEEAEESDEAFASWKSDGSLGSGFNVVMPYYFNYLGKISYGSMGWNNQLGLVVPSFDNSLTQG